MIHLSTLTERSADAFKVERLYLRSFPENERISMEQFWRSPHGQQVYGCYDVSGFCGFVQVLSYQDIAHILYFAVLEAHRGKGYGHQILSLLHRLCPESRIIADIEALDPMADNYLQRCHRKAFYLSCGFCQTSIKYCWRGESYEILAIGGDITEYEFSTFWRHFHLLEQSGPEEAKI